MRAAQNKGDGPPPYLIRSPAIACHTVAKVMRVLSDRDLPLPRRDRFGELRWARATFSAVARILKNPAYAGAFVYERTRFRAAGRDGGSEAKNTQGY